MADKRTTLPSNFGKAVASGDLARMIAVFDKTDVNATAGRGGTNALGTTAAPPELLRWLVDHGADPNLRDTYGATPLREQIYGRNLVNIETLIGLGADVDDVETVHSLPSGALMCAATNQRPEVVRLLLERPQRKRLLSRRPVVPLNGVVEAALHHCPNARIPETVETVELLLAAGAKVTAQARDHVTEIGTTFERMRDAFDTESLPEHGAALERLYQLTGVTPVAAPVRHDGTSPIEVPAGSLSRQVEALWLFLVPGAGAATTAQGEAIRIVGRVGGELLANGGMNWDDDYRAMLTMLPTLLGSGEPLPPEDLTEVASIGKRLPRGDAETLTDTLNAHVIAWIRANPTPIPLATPPYRR